MENKYYQKSGFFYLFYLDTIPKAAKITSLYSADNNFTIVKEIHQGMMYSLLSTLVAVHQKLMCNFWDK